MSVKDVNYLYWFFLFVIGRTTHLPELNYEKWIELKNVASLLRFSFKILLSIERVRYAIVSSVNRLNVPRFIHVGGTPDLMMSDISSSMTTHCVLPERKPFVHVYFFSFDSILIKCVDKETVTYFTNACEKSMMRQYVWCPLSLFLVMSSMNSTSITSWVSNANCFLNSFCFVKDVVWSAWCSVWLVSGIYISNKCLIHKRIK